MSLETITLEKVTKYGGRANGKAYNYGKKYTGEAFEEGGTYEVDVWTSPSGAKYINTAKRLAGVVSVPTQTTTVGGSTIVVEAIAARAGDDKGFKSGLSYAEKDARILVQGITQSVAGSTYLASATDDTNFIDRVTALSSQLIRYVLDKSKNI